MYWAVCSHHCWQIKSILDQKRQYYYFFGHRHQLQRVQISIGKTSYYKYDFTLECVHLSKMKVCVMKNCSSSVFNSRFIFDGSGTDRDCFVAFLECLCCSSVLLCSCRTKDEYPCLSYQLNGLHAGKRAGKHPLTSNPL